MEIAVMLSGFSGLAAALLASALWATRPTPLSSDGLSPDEEITTRLPRLSP
jgi:hypothetical protein